MFVIVVLPIIYLVFKMALNVLGIWSVAIFYLLILLVGIGAACIQKRRRRCRSDSISSQPQEDIMLASRNLSLVAGVFTMTGMSLNFISI